MAGKTATEMNTPPRRNVRADRAMALAGVIMWEINDVVPGIDQRAVYDRLVCVLHQNGACWTTEAERAAMGFEPRDDLGWTPSDRVAERQAKIEAMQLMMAGMGIPTKTP